MGEGPTRIKRYGKERKKDKDGKEVKKTVVQLFHPLEDMLGCTTGG